VILDKRGLFSKNLYMMKFTPNNMISTVTATMAGLNTAQIMTYSIIAVVSLIVFLALKEILSSETKRPSVKLFLKGSNVAIIPLLLVFVAIVAYKVVTIL